MMRSILWSIFLSFLLLITIPLSSSFVSPKSIHYTTLKRLSPTGANEKSINIDVIGNNRNNLRGNSYGGGYSIGGTAIKCNPKDVKDYLEVR